MEIRIYFGDIWGATKRAAKKIKETVVNTGKAIANADEEKIELIMRTKNVDRATAKIILKEYREERDKESVKTVTIDNLKR